MMLNDIKSLKRLNGDKNVAETSFNSNSRKFSGQGQEISYYNGASSNDYVKIPKDISIIISNSGLDLTDLSLCSIDSQTPIGQRMYSDFTQ